MRQTRLLALVMVFAALFALQAGIAQATRYISPWQPIYHGIDYAYGTEDTPRLMKAFALRIDLQNPYVTLYASHDNGTAPYEVTNEQATTFLAQHGCKTAINASYVNPNLSPNTDIWGLTISDGTVVSTGDYGSPFDVQLLFTADKVASIVQSLSTPAGIHTAVSGDAYHLVNGVPLGANDYTHPRTSAGLSQDNRYLILVCVDGRQEGWSMGATILDMSYWQLDFGSWNAMNLDGGGSTVMVRADVGVVNRPCYGYVRSVGVHLGTKSSYLNPNYTFTNDNQGWYPGNQANGVWHAPAPGWPGCMYFDQTGDDCWVYSAKTAFTGAANEAMSVVVYPQNGSTASHDMQLFWTTTEEPNFDAAKSSPVVAYSAQNAWATVNLDLNNAKWVGKVITQLRLDVDQVNHGNRWIVDSMTRVPGAVPDIIIDNPQGSCSANWITSTMSSQKYGADYKYRSTAAISDPFTWRPTIVTAGNYEVYAWWPAGSNRSATAPYIVYYNGGSAQCPRNQQTAGGQWNSLGTYNFAAGTTGNVKLSCWTTTGFVVCADAIKFVKRP